MRRFLIRNFYSHHYSKLFGLHFNPLRIGFWNACLFYMLGLIMAFGSSWMYCVAGIYGIFLIFINFVYFRLFPVQWEELSDSQKLFSYESFSKKDINRFKFLEWSAINNNYKYIYSKKYMFNYLIAIRDVLFFLSIIIIMLIKYLG